MNNEKSIFEEKNKYEESIISFIDQVEERIEYLQESKDEVEERAKEEFQQKVDLLNEKKQALEEKAHEIKQTSQETWSKSFKSIDASIGDVAKETRNVYRGIQTGFGYLFDKLN